MDRLRAIVTICAILQNSILLAQEFHNYGSSTVPDSFPPARKIMAFSSADFLLVRKSDNAKIDLLSTSGKDVSTIFGHPDRLIRIDPRSEEDKNKELYYKEQFTVTVDLYYSAIRIHYDENRNNGAIREIRIDDSGFATARGIAVGDTIDKLYEKYPIDDAKNLYFESPEEIQHEARANITYKPFRYVKYYKFELTSNNTDYYDRGENGEYRVLGMNFFVDKSGHITHIDYYHEAM